jgi:4-amino-4-deoxy-L-arabinose transferase-like glycosyltransferase
MTESRRASLSERYGALAPLAAFALVAATLLVPLALTGLWDPAELRAIEWARRIALGLFGGHGLELSGAENALPSRGELDRGELPFTSMALGLRCFGLHAWAARLPLAVCALLGAGATYLLVRRLAERRAAIASVLVLGSMPLFFLHARTLLGDGVTMAAQAVATAGLALAVFDTVPRARRIGWAALATLGLGAGLMCRGVLLGVSVPLLGIGLSWLVLRLAGARAPGSNDVPGALVLVLGMLAAALGLRLLLKALDEPERYFLWLGFGINRGAVPPTFDAVIGVLGHALFPWSAVVPVALARLAWLPPGLEPAAYLKESALRLSVVLTAAVGLGVWGGVAPYAGVLPFGPVAALAVVVALALVDIDRGAPSSRAAGMTVAALLVLLVADFVNLPDKAMTAFGVEGAHFPDSFRHEGQHWLAFAGALGALAFFGALLEGSDGEAPAFERREYARWLSVLRDQWNGNLLFGVCLVEATLLGFLAFDLLGERVPALARWGVAGEAGHLGVRVAWLALPVALVVPWLALALRDVVRWLMRLRTALAARPFRVFVPTRAGLATAGLAAGGFALSAGFYPALAAQLSPASSFESFRRHAGPGEELGLVGSSSTAAAYAAGRSVVSLAGPDEAYEWLTGSKDRRWLVLKADLLNGLNSRYRGRTRDGRNLPILDGSSSEVLLASNRLLAGETNQNPLDRYLLARAPAPTHPLDANLGGQLDVLGWDVTTLDQEPVRALVPGRRYEFVIYFRVVARISGTWETFVHIDGFQRRFNADHPTLDGHYPFSLWNIGDIVADRHAFTLEPNFTRGLYQVYFGLYSASRRLAVTRGAAVDDRLEGGGIEVE